MQWSQNPDTLEVILSSTATSGIMEKMKGRVRLTKADIEWHLRPLPSGKIEVTNFAHINPGSSLPGWITNMLLVDTPFQTLQDFSEAVRNPEYAAASFNFVTKPDHPVESCEQYNAVC